MSYPQNESTRELIHEHKSAKHSALKRKSHGIGHTAIGWANKLKGLSETKHFGAKKGARRAEALKKFKFKREHVGQKYDSF